MFPRYLKLLCAIALTLAVTHCSNRSNAPNVSPPLPPAEEPVDDAQTTLGPDSGAALHE
jgi:hypothetical protein